MPTPECKRKTYKFASLSACRALAIVLVVKDARCGQKFGKVDDLSVGRGLRLVVPANVHSSAQGLHRYKFIAGLREGRFYALDNFTHRVSVPKMPKTPPVLALRGV